MRNLISLYARSSKDFAGWPASGARLARVADEIDCVAALLMASPLSDVRKHLDIVAIRDTAVSDRIPQLEHESVGGTNAAAGGESSAEHYGALPQFTVSVNDCLRREHRGHGSFLIQALLAALVDPRTQYQRVPMVAHVIEWPQLWSDGLVAHLFRSGDVIGLDLAVRVAGSSAHPDFAGVTEEKEFNLSARVLTNRFDLP